MTCSDAGGDHAEDLVASVTIIPHTIKMTSLQQHRPGSRVNLECDVFAKYLEKIIPELALPLEHMSP